MISKSVRWQAGALLLLLLCLPLALRAQLSKQDEETAKDMIKGTLYLRLDVPLRSEVGNWGIGSAPLLEVSPTGHDTARLLGQVMNSKEMTATSKFKKRERIDYVFYPNYAIHAGTLKFNGDEADLMLEGFKPINYEVTINFVQIKSIGDFTKAFNQTFSKVPLQDEHPEWPVEVRNAIAEHRLIVGMSKEQAFDVVGTPLDTTSNDTNEGHVEIWHPRQDKGQAIDRRGHIEELGGTGFPVSITFKDGKLLSIKSI
jgi:hypothetical protein